jgi:putative inorganic carbon (HCO3(-)) transporter
LTTEDGDPLEPVFDENGQQVKEEPRIRSIGFLNDPNDLAQTLATFFVFLGFFWTKSKAKNLLILVPAGVVVLYGVFLTRSRGGLVAVGVMALLAFRERLGKVMAGILTGLLITGALAVNITGGRAMKDESAEARIEAWASGILMLRQNPMLGVGYRNFVEEHGGLTAHNSYVLCFAEMGLLGYFCWMSLLVVSFIQLIRLRHLPGDTPEIAEIRKLALIVRLAFTTFLTAAFFLSRTYVLTLFILIGLSLCLADIARRSGYSHQKLQPRFWTKQTLIWQVVSIFVVWLTVKVNGM